MDRFASANQSGQMAGYIWNMKARQAKELITATTAMRTLYARLKR